MRLCNATALIAGQSHRVGEKHELRSLCDRVQIFTATSRHVGKISPINTNGFARATPNRGAQTIHRGVASTENGDPFAFDFYWRTR